METQKPPRKSAAYKDVYTIINDKIIEQLEKGIIPWNKPWTKAGIPRNMVSLKPATGINLLLLATLDYERNFFITENQLAEISGAIKAKEKPHIVSWWSYNEIDGVKQSPVFTYYHVYNVAQCVLPPNALPELMTATPVIVPSAEIIEGMPQKPVLKHKDKAAYYDIFEDVVIMPRPAKMDEPDYVGEYLHQLVHSTGHYTRLDRMGLAQMKKYGYPDCSLEEVVTEIATWQLKSIAGIAGYEKPTDEYLKALIAKLKKDRMFILTAASYAQKAVDFILNTKPEEAEQAREIAAS